MDLLSSHVTVHPCWAYSHSQLQALCNCTSDLVTKKVYYSKVSDCALIWWENLTGLSAYCRGYVSIVSSFPFQKSGTWILRSLNKGSVPGTWCLPCLRPAVNYLVEKSNLTSVANLGFPCGSAGKESTCNVGDLVSIPGLGRFPEEGKGYPLQDSGLENSRDSTVSPWGS